MIIGSQIPDPVPDDILRIDDQLAEKGIPVLRRPLEATKIWGDEHGGVASALDKESIFSNAYRQLHPSVPFDGAAFLTLCVSARAISYFVRPPVVIGEYKIVPVDYVSITKPELERLWDRYPDAYNDLTYQSFDAVDLFLAHMNYHSRISGVANMMSTSINQMTASARQLVAGEIDLSIPQGLAMAVELAGKSVLLKEGASPDDLPNIGHNLVELADAVAARVPSPIDDQVQAVAATLPKYVAVRYDAPALNMSQAQDVYRRALFVIADFLRRTNHSRGYWDILNQGQMPSRDWSPFV